MKQIIGFIGGGNMASSLIGGLIDNGTMSAEQLVVHEPNADKLKALAQQFKIRKANSNTELVELCDIVVIAVKPQVLEEVLTPLSSAIKAKQPLLISVVAGIPASLIEQWLNTELAIIRVMPNTPALIGEGASGLYANTQVSQSQREQATLLLDAVGCSAWVTSESDIDSVTALSGSGPAYFMLFIKSLIEAGVKAGLDEDTAKQLAIKTASGTAALIESSDLDLQTLIDNVTSPGGTTEQALKSFHQSGLPQVVEDAFSAAKNRSEELAKELS